MPLIGATVVDVGAGTGRSTFELAERAARVLGIEPNAAMRAVAERRAVEARIANVIFAAGSASAIPCADASADVVAAVTATMWPPETVVPEFVAEAMRVLRPGGVVFTLNTPPGWYGGDLHDVVTGTPEYDRTLDAALEAAGFAARDFETVQDYGTTEHAVRTYGFIFGSRAIAHLRETGRTRIRWRWRLHHCARDAATTPRRRPGAASP